MSQERVVSYFYLKIFVVIIIILIIGSLFFKIGYEIVNSKFRNNSFSVLLVGPDSKLIFVDKNTKSARFFALGDIRKYVKGKDNLGAGVVLGVPVNAMIMDDKPPQNLAAFTSGENQTRLLFDRNLVIKGMDKYDIYKFVNEVKGALEDNREEMRVNLFDENSRKEKIKDSFKDSVITNMPYTVEIDNGTTINGLGGDVAYVLSQQGFNVIAVRTVGERTNSYIAYPGEKNSFIDALMSLTGFELKKAKISQAADVTVYLGDDLEAMLLP